VSVNEMTDDRAADLLPIALAEAPVGQAWQLLDELARYLGKWPLLLNLVGAYLDRLIRVERITLPEAITMLRQRLERRGFTALDVAELSAS
jgi:hypothetical protein